MNDIEKEIERIEKGKVWGKIGLAMALIIAFGCIGILFLIAANWLINKIP